MLQKNEHFYKEQLWHNKIGWLAIRCLSFGNEYETYKLLMQNAHFQNDLHEAESEIDLDGCYESLFLKTLLTGL